MATTIYGPGGKPIITPDASKIAILKVPQGSVTPEVVQMVAKVISTAGFQALLIMPHEHELVLGELVHKELRAIHRVIHDQYGMPSIHLTKEELGITLRCLEFMDTKIKLPPESKEAQLKTKLEAYFKVSGAS